MTGSQPTARRLCLSLSRFALTLGLGVLLVACGGGDEREKFDPTGHYEPEEAEEIHDAIQALAAIKDIDDPDAEVRYYRAQSELIAFGSQAQPQLIEALNGSQDWGVRLGAIHVLDAVGTEDCVESLISALQDDHPLVAQKAMYSLRVFCDHRIVPEPGTEVGDEGLPPIPSLAEGQPPEMQELIWTRWYLANGTRLADAWRLWYRDHGNKVSAR